MSYDPVAAKAALSVGLEPQDATDGLTTGMLNMIIYRLSDYIRQFWVDNPVADVRIGQKTIQALTMIAGVTKTQATSSILPILTGQGFSAEVIDGDDSGSAWASPWYIRISIRALLTGPRGATGAAGAAGHTILAGAGAPAGGTGSNGDFYIDTTADAIYGPKTGGAWGSGTSLVGAAGDAGANAMVLYATCGNGSGCRDCPGAQVGDTVVFVRDTADGADYDASFENTITVVDKIQQSGTDLTGKTAFVSITRAAA